MLPLLVPFLLAGPPGTTDPPRQDGFHVDTTTGALITSAPNDRGWSSFTGVALRTDIAYRYLIGERWRFGPKFVTSVSFASMTAEDGTTSSAGHGQLAAGAEFEWEITSSSSVPLSLSFSTILMQRTVYLGPEFSIGFEQLVPARDVYRRLGIPFRFTAIPLFGVGRGDPGYMLMVTLGFSGGVP